MMKLLTQGKTSAHFNDLPWQSKKGNAAIDVFYVPKEKSLFGLGFLRWGYRAPYSGWHKRLLIDDKVMMSNTVAEFRDNNECLWQAKGRVLIHGLGLGLLVHQLLEKDDVEHIRVVEINQNVIDLVSPTIDDPRVEIVHGDCLKIKANGERWDFIWHDIWFTYNEDVHEESKFLHRRWGRRCEKQASWGRSEYVRESRYCYF